MTQYPFSHCFLCLYNIPLKICNLIPHSNPAFFSVTLCLHTHRIYVMGICASSQYTSKGRIALNWPSTAKIIHLDGTLQELRDPIKAGNILSQNPDCFLCSSESMYINSHVPLIPQNEELQLGQIYFLMPLSNSHEPLSLQDLCTLAIKAHAALTHSDPGSTKT